MNKEPQFSSLAPITFDGWAISHTFYRINFAHWNTLATGEKEEVVEMVQRFLDQNTKTENGESALFGIMGNKADIMLLQFRPDLESLKRAENQFHSLRLMPYLERTYSYTSFVELGMYEYTLKLEKELKEKGFEPESEAFEQGWADALKEQKERLMGRLYTEIPEEPYVCFYPMNKKRSDQNNWYALPMETRQKMMREHGMIGRKYAGKVNQIISGSIGFDDWEWGVDLFAKDPLVFKKLVYEMRFDEASALYGDFGPFYVGFRFLKDDIYRFFVPNV